jgi:carbonic anhydrase
MTPHATLVNLTQLVESLNFNELYHYQGSLTTPPCSENVSWLVVNDPQPISTAQVQMFNNMWSANEAFAGGQGNNREVQKANGRTIYKKSPANNQPLITP